MAAPQVQALLLDMDGVMAEVSLSYRNAIVETAKHFGVSVTLDEVEQHKLAGNANNDWALTQRLVASKLDADAPSLQEVTQVFEDIYQGVDGTPGLCELETLLTPKGLLEELHRRLPNGMAVVTGRPRKDCDKFLAAHGCVCCVCAYAWCSDGDVLTLQCASCLPTTASRTSSRCRSAWRTARRSRRPSP